MSFPKQRRIAVMGFRSVGKSSLTIQFAQNQFTEEYHPTIESSYTKRHLIRNQNYDVTVVDTCGQDEYSIFPYRYCMEMHGYVLVYSIDDARSFEVTQIIYDKLLDTSGNYHARVPVVLVGNKKDLNDERVVQTAEGLKAARKMKAVFLESSAKNNDAVCDVFNTIIGQVDKYYYGTLGQQQQQKNCSVM